MIKEYLGILGVTIYQLKEFKQLNNIHNAAFLAKNTYSWIYEQNLLS